MGGLNAVVYLSTGQPPLRFHWLAFLKGLPAGPYFNFSDPDRDPLGAGYHVIQSKIAIGSGDTGKGYLHGTEPAGLPTSPAHRLHLRGFPGGGSSAVCCCYCST